MAELDVAVVAGAEVDIDLGGEASGESREKSRGLLGKGRDPRPIYSDFPGSGIQGAVAGTPLYINFGGPASGRIWDIRQLVSFGQDDRTQGQQSSGTAAGAAGQTLTLPAGQALSSFTVTMAGVPAVNVLVTVTGGVGGTLSYQLTDGPNGVVFTQSFVPPLMPATPTTSIVITIPAVVAAGASAITATTYLPVAWYKATNDPNAFNTPMITNLLVPGTRFVPDTVVPGSSESLFVKFREILVAVVYGVPANGQAGGIARVADWPDTVPEARYNR